MMHRYRYDAACHDGWKSYPIRLTTKAVSQCCNEPRVLVQSMDGGFVTANCRACLRKDTLSAQEFRALPVYVTCPECGNPMKPDYVPDKSGGRRNYGFRCGPCSLYIWLADLLPHWENVVCSPPA